MPHRDGQPFRVPVVGGQAYDAVGVPQGLEEAALTQFVHPPARHLLPEDRQPAHRVGLVVHPRVGEHPRLRVLDRDRAPDQGRHRVGELREVAEPQPLHPGPSGRGAVGQSGAQLTEHLRPPLPRPPGEQRGAPRGGRLQQRRPGPAGPPPQHHGRGSGPLRTTQHVDRLRRGGIHPDREQDQSGRRPGAVVPLLTRVVQHRVGHRHAGSARRHDDIQHAGGDQTEDLLERRPAVAPVRFPCCHASMMVVRAARRRLSPSAKGQVATAASGAGRVSDGSCCGCAAGLPQYARPAARG
ncbi:hypothetical protein B0E38_02510 [Streptomyces sp. 111WW2]|nr:hypothetical protein B0E38_02510 [Streptomyces sp. 111WW2]